MRWSPYLWLVRWLRLAHRSAVRAEFEQALADWQSAAAPDFDPISDDEAARIRTFLANQGITATEAQIIPLSDFRRPVVHPNHSKPPPSAA